MVSIRAESPNKNRDMPGTQYGRLTDQPYSKQLHQFFGKSRNHQRNKTTRNHTQSAESIRKTKVHKFRGESHYTDALQFRGETHVLLPIGRQFFPGPARNYESRAFTRSSEELETLRFSRESPAAVIERLYTRERPPSWSRWVEPRAGAHRRCHRRSGKSSGGQYNRALDDFSTPVYYCNSVPPFFFHFGPLSFNDICIALHSISPASYLETVSAWSREYSKYTNLKVQTQDYCLQYDRPCLFYPIPVPLSLSALSPTWLRLRHLIVHPMAVVYILSLCRFLSLPIYIFSIPGADPPREEEMVLRSQL